MNIDEWSEKARQAIQPGSEIVQWHMKYMEALVRVDSRSFNVNEFPGDRTTPTDMKEILALAEEYLRAIGFPTVRINTPPAGPERSTPILMAEIEAGAGKPTVLLYAHLDKQPYMDDERFEKWGGYPPTELRWNAEGTRAYGRGAADDLSGVIAIGLAVDALLKALGFDPAQPSNELIRQLPCNLKVIFETEEESGSHTLIPQILQNREFFEPSDCVIITDVINPDTGVPGLTTSLRGILQMKAHMVESGGPLDAQTALYKVLATLIHDDHSLAVEKIAAEDAPVTEEERRGYENIPASVDTLRRQAGLLTETRLTVPADTVEVIIGEFRTSYVNVRPGHRVSGGVVLGIAGARLQFQVEGLKNRSGFVQALQQFLRSHNSYQLRMSLRETEASSNSRVELDLLLQSADKDPHSGMFGGPFPVPELQLARMIDRLVAWDGSMALPGATPCFESGGGVRRITSSALHAEHGRSPRQFQDPSARAVVEIRLAPGHNEFSAQNHLMEHLLRNTPEGFTLHLEPDKGGPPWMTSIDHPAFTLMLNSLHTGYDRKPCLYGCGGSIPFVAMLMKALGNIPPLCLGVYDPDCRMHEPGESLSLIDLLGCSRSIVHFLLHCPRAFR